ncbi:MAG: glucose 1-dehydrogenase [Thermomicrobiales bacterium]|nr:glucose 1-dehydrogenase [Thermomicrobiales bacterium]
MPVATTGSVTGVAVYPGRPGSVHLTRLAPPLPGPDEVLVTVRRVGVCGTDKEIIDGHFGSPPPGSDELVLGHEVIGTVTSIGDHVQGLRPGELVVATVRRPDDCPSCRAGQSDFCQWRRYTERGIIGLHGFMIERFVERPQHLISVPPPLEPVGVLLEPLSVVEKALRVARAVQQRLIDSRPATAVIFGAGPIGLLGTLLLRSEGVEVYTVARRPAPNLASSIVEAAGGHYVSTSELSPGELARSIPNIDLIFECSGNSEPAFEGMSLLGSNGVLVLLSLTGGDRKRTVPTDAINREFVLGNKLMVGSVNSHRTDFIAGVDHLARFENLWPGLTGRLITTRLSGFDEAERIQDVGGIKTVVELGS